ncbi:MAG TPA: hypothetical protein DER09_09560 [Prolixibacteraceae bacterium]|nr:hypothetical protein [Prolixibacteraceae bacterium]
MNMLRFFITQLFLFIIFISTCNAQKDLLQGINLGGELGISRFLTELPMDFSGAISEFDHKTNLTFDIQLSKYVAPHWEVGTGFNNAVLSGYAETPDFSAEGVSNGGLVNIGELDGPVEYKTRLLGQDFFVRYFLIKVDEQDHLNINPFLKFGGGYINYMSELIDLNTGEVVPGTAKYQVKLTTASMKLGTGFKTYLSDRLNLIASLDFNFVDYDYLDVVHNYSESGERLKVTGIYTEFKIGLYINITQFEAGKGRRKKYAIPEYLPFSPK